MSGYQPPGPRFRTWSDLSGRTQLRIGDIEREAAVTALGEHYATGRLSKEEYDERANVAYEARTLAALQPLFADLPLPHGPLQPGPPPMRGPQPQGRRSRPHFPVFPLVLLLIGVALLTGLHLFPLLLLVFGGMLLFKSVRHRTGGHRSGHTSGSCFGGRGSWR
jgi:hypothetical protein